jgi:hypothetical protein
LRSNRWGGRSISTHIRGGTGVMDSRFRASLGPGMTGDQNSTSSSSRFGQIVVDPNFRFSGSRELAIAAAVKHQRGDIRLDAHPFNQQQDKLMIAGDNSPID